MTDIPSLVLGSDIMGKTVRLFLVRVSRTERRFYPHISTDCCHLLAYRGKAGRNQSTVFPRRSITVSTESNTVLIHLTTCHLTLTRMLQASSV